MMFYRVNEHMVSCAIGESEITQMGYHITELYKDKELAGRFMKEVYEKAREIGFEIGDHIQTVQVAVTQNHQFILNFIEVNPEEQINDTLQNLLDAAETVEFIGKDRLEEILSMTGDEKMDAFQECMLEIRKEFYQDTPLLEGTDGEPEDGNLLDGQSTEADMSGEEDSTSEEISGSEVMISGENISFDNTVKKTVEEKEEQDKKEIQKRNRQAIYSLFFPELSKVEEFARKAVHTVPGRLYKDAGKGQYIMLVELGDLSQEKQGSFIFLAEGYTTKIIRGTQILTYLEEHGEVIIKSDPIAVLKEI